MSHAATFAACHIKSPSISAVKLAYTLDTGEAKCQRALTLAFRKQCIADDIAFNNCRLKEAVSLLRLGQVF